jgi:hypothetical protein
LKELGEFQREKRLMDDVRKQKHLEAVIAIQEKHGVVARIKERASQKELAVMIGMVLDTGNSGTKVIKAYALQEDKDDQWRQDIAKAKAGKSFELALASYSNHPVMGAIEKSPTYCKKNLLNQTVTGALRLLSKHVMANREIEAKELENQKLKEMLELKESLAGKAPDWELAKQLRSEGEKIIRIAQVLGVGRSTVYNHLAKG